MMAPSAVTPPCLGRSIWDVTGLNEGQFLRSLLTRGKGSIRMLFQHDPAEPIGVWEEIREDEKGLYVRGRIVSQTARGQEVLNLMRAGAIDGLSIGFRDRKKPDRKHIRHPFNFAGRSLGNFDCDLPDAATGTGIAGKKTDTRRRPAVCPPFENLNTGSRRTLGFLEARRALSSTRGFATLAGKRDAARISNQGLIRRLRRLSGSIQPNHNTT